jgi:hypothetical protein
MEFVFQEKAGCRVGKWLPADWLIADTNIIWNDLRAEV